MIKFEVGKRYKYRCGNGNIPCPDAECIKRDDCRVWFKFVGDCDIRHAPWFDDEKGCKTEAWMEICEYVVDRWGNMLFAYNVV